MEPEALAVVDGDEVPVGLGDAVRAAGIEGRRLALRRLARPSEHLRGGGLVEARLRTDLADPLEQAGDPDRRVLGGGDGEPPGLGDRRHRREVVDLVRRAAPEHADQRVLVEEVARVKGDPIDRRVEPLEVPVGGPVDEAVDLVALLEQELGEIGAVLPADPGDQRRASRSRQLHRIERHLERPLVALERSPRDPLPGVERDLLASSAPAGHSSFPGLSQAPRGRSGRCRRVGGVEGRLGIAEQLGIAEVPLAATGAPQVIASRIGRPAPSYREGKTKSSQPR